MQCGEGIRERESNEDGFIVECEGKVEEEVEDEPKGWPIGMLLWHRGDR
jgi:hypothetical protein